MVGLDPSAYILKYIGRCPVVHLKDWAEGTTNGTVELGNGILDIPEIIRASVDAGVQWLVIEQEFFEKSCLESARTSIEYLKKNMPIQ